MIDARQALNPELYSALKRRFQQGVKIANQGAPLTVVITHDSLHNNRLNADIRSFGEAYRVCCPVCRDTKFRLYINHRYGTKDPVTGFYFGKFMMHCFNEECKQPDFRDELAVYMNRDVQLTISTVKTDRNISRARLPGKCVPLSQLKADGVVHTYLKSRNFDPDVLERDFYVAYCYDAYEEYPAMTGRIVIPIYYHNGLVGWQGRTPLPNVYPKYYTMPGFPKGQILYNYDRARTKPLVVICEGVMDVMRIGDCGVCVFGHHISSEQSRLIQYNWGQGTGIVVFDSKDEKAQASANTWVEAARKGELFAGGVANVVLPEDDPADMTKEDLWAEIYRQCSKQKVKVQL